MILTSPRSAGMVGALDESVGEVVAALEEKGILDNTIIVFSTDNGGAANGYDGSRGSNWPLRSVWNIFAPYCISLI